MCCKSHAGHAKLGAEAELRAVLDLCMRTAGGSPGLRRRGQPVSVSSRSLGRLHELARADVLSMADRNLCGALPKQSTFVDWAQLRIKPSQSPSSLRVDIEFVQVFSK